MNSIYNVEAVVNISFSGKRLLAGVENEIEVKCDRDGEALALLFEQGKLINLGDDMVILKSAVKTKDGDLKPGTRIDGVLADEVVQELIEKGYAVDTKGTRQSVEQEQDATEDDDSTTGDDSGSDDAGSGEDDDSADGDDSDSGENADGSDDDADIDPSTLNDDDVLYTDEESLSKMTADDLKKLAKDVEIQGYANMKKADLVKAISKHFEEGDAE